MGSAKSDAAPRGRALHEETVSSESTGPGLAAPRTARLVIVQPRELAGELPLDEATRALGRQAGADVQLIAPHTTVSRRHASLTWDAAAGSHCVADLGSHNGTWLDGKPVDARPCHLEDQAVLRFGDVLAVYERCDVASFPHASRCVSDRHRAGAHPSECAAVAQR